MEQAARRPDDWLESEELQEHLKELTSDLRPFDAELAREIVLTAVKLARDSVTRLDRKIINSALKEMRYAFRVFAPYRGIRKVSIFGSARTRKGDPNYQAAVEFSRAMAEKGWMVITGAGPGIMEAGHEGAGGDMSFGVNIRLPFEADPNPVIAEDPKLINFKYFFTRKLMFVREADAFVLLPGGFGTLDEVLELLTLIQTGKSELYPVVMLDPPGSDYWLRFDAFLREVVMPQGFISERDLNLWTRLQDARQAVEEIQRFYRVYHSQRVVGNRLILRLKQQPADGLVQAWSEEFRHMLLEPIKSVGASPQEVRDQDVPDLPRLALKFDWSYVGDLRRLIDQINELE